MARTKIVELDHVGLNVRSLSRARKFYRAALGAIGMRINLEFSSAFGMGSQKQLIFWLGQDRKAQGGVHHAFRVTHREDVDAFHRAALAAGGTDNGPPGLRPDYGPNYYAAFVHDPEGNNIEVVCYGKPVKRLHVRRARAMVGA